MPKNNGHPSFPIILYVLPGGGLVLTGFGLYSLLFDVHVPVWLALASIVVGTMCFLFGLWPFIKKNGD